MDDGTSWSVVVVAFAGGDAARHSYAYRRDAERFAKMASGQPGVVRVTIIGDSGGSDRKPAAPAVVATGAR